MATKEEGGLSEWVGSDEPERESKLEEEGTDLMKSHTQMKSRFRAMPCHGQR